MKPKDLYLKALARRDVEIRRLVAAGAKSKSAVARLYGISRERVRQIVNTK